MPPPLLHGLPRPLPRSSLPFPMAGRQAGSGLCKMLRVAARGRSTLAGASSRRCAVVACDGAPAWQGAASSGLPTLAAAAAFSGVAAAQAACEAADSAPALANLKSIRDAKEIVLYQYAVCPFCNKVQQATRAKTSISLPDFFIFFFF